MRGQILGVDTRSGEGQISGEDGVRYTFKPDDWSGERGPAVGLNVDFAAEEGRAVRIFRLPDAAGAVTTAPQRAAKSGPNRIVAAVLAFFLGMLGVHKFYLGKTGAGITMLLGGTIGWLLVLPGLLVTLIAFIEFVIYLITDDEVFERRYVEGDKSWF